MKSSKFISASFLSAIMIVVACKKDEPSISYQPIPARQIQSALIYQYGKDIPIENVTVNLETCKGTLHWVWGGFFGSWQCDEPLETYRTVLTGVNGSFSFDVDSTLSYEFGKSGYWTDSYITYGAGWPDTADSIPIKQFLIRDAWLKIHFTNVGSPNSVDSIIISAGPDGTSFAHLYLPVYGSNIEYYSFPKAYGEAANYVKWSTIHNGIQQDSIITFYINAGDTASVDINY